MSLDQLDLFRRAVAVADATVAAVRPDQFDHPTPCSEWTVRQLLNHLVTGNLIFLSFATGAPPPDRTADHLGDDHVAAFRSSVRRLTQAFEAPGFLEREVHTPFGPGTGSVLVTMRFNEHMVHSWDLARSTGQSTDLDRDLAERSLAWFRGSAALARARSEGGQFGVEQPAPTDATPADRLAAFVGRRLET